MSTQPKSTFLPPYAPLSRWRTPEAGQPISAGHLTQAQYNMHLIAKSVQHGRTELPDNPFSGVTSRGTAGGYEPYNEYYRLGPTLILAAHDDWTTIDDEVIYTPPVAPLELIIGLPLLQATLFEVGGATVYNFVGEIQDDGTFRFRGEGGTLLDETHAAAANPRLFSVHGVFMTDPQWGEGRLNSITGKPST